jgi:hypothetical protein
VRKCIRVWSRKRRKRGDDACSRNIVNQQLCTRGAIVSLNKDTLVSMYIPVFRYSHVQHVVAHNRAIAYLDIRHYVS